jgi:hypothetical protein
MSSYGKINFIGMLALPCIAALGSLAVLGARLDTQLFVFGTNIVPMLIGGLISALLLRSVAKAGGRGALIALAPTLAPGYDAGREYFAGPMYLLLGVVVTGIAAWVGCRLSRAGG